MILLDGRPLQGASGVRGIGTYARGLIRALEATSIGIDLQLLLASDRPDPPETSMLREPPARLQMGTLHPTLQPLADPILVAAALRRYRPSLYHALEWGQPVWARCPVLVTVHDLIPFLYPHDYPWVRRARIPALRLLRHASRVITPSQATANDVQRMARVPATRVRVVPEGVDSGFQPASPSQVGATLRALDIPGRYVLTVGTFDPRKRITVLAAAFARVRAAYDDVSLVVAGDQGTFVSAVRASLAEAGLSRHSVVTGLVSQDMLTALYTGAACFVLTSSYEGFGLPPLEAMACGAPVVMFRNSALSEVAGPANLVTPDGDPVALAASIAGVLGESRQQSDRQAGIAWARRFTWARAAERTVDIYREVLGSSDRGDRSARSGLDA